MLGNWVALPRDCVATEHTVVTVTDRRGITRSACCKTHVFQVFVSSVGVSPCFVFTLLLQIWQRDVDGHCCSSRFLFLSVKHLLRWPGQVIKHE
jgi:hypothetical protein